MYRIVGEDNFRKVHDCCVSGDYLFILLPKCASTTMKRVLTGVGWRHSKILEGKQYVSIVRHPFDRWVSAVLQLNRAVPTENFLDASYVKSLVDASPYSMVMYPQSYFFDNRSPLFLFKFDELDKLWPWLITRGFNSTPKDVHENGSENDAHKQEILVNLITTLNSNPQFEDKLMEIYSDDLDYYNGVK